LSEDKTPFQVGDVIADFMNQQAIGFIKRLDFVAGAWYHVIEWFDGHPETRQKVFDIILVSRANNEV
jgi:hypothetical protein